MIYKLYNVKNISVPLLSEKKESIFKVYFNDIGLLSRMYKVEYESIKEDGNLLSNYKGALAEQFVFQQLNCLDSIDLYYWSTVKNTAELDFIVDYNNTIIPIEVKSGLNVKAKSLASYINKYNPSICIKCSLLNFNIKDNIFSIPLYAINQFIKVISK
ncbi:MAG: DUF4143 domain-containing protein [Bacilli bacterium]|nr:DUF4143 domain-containing protein [Bacilli bacterium]